jgi:hypothetical protein
MVNRCPRCSHEAECDAPPESCVLACGECGARIAYGELAPRITIEPDTTKRFVLLSIKPAKGEHVTYKIDAQLAALTGVSLISLTVGR